MSNWFKKIRELKCACNGCTSQLKHGRDNQVDNICPTHGRLIGESCYRYGGNKCKKCKLRFCDNCFEGKLCKKCIIVLSAEINIMHDLVGATRSSVGTRPSRQESKININVTEQSPAPSNDQN